MPLVSCLLVLLWRDCFTWNLFALLILCFDLVCCCVYCCCWGVVLNWICGLLCCGMLYLRDILFSELIVCLLAWKLLDLYICGCFLFVVVILLSLRIFYWSALLRFYVLLLELCGFWLLYIVCWFEVDFNSVVWYCVFLFLDFIFVCCLKLFLWLFCWFSLFVVVVCFVYLGCLFCFWLLCWLFAVRVDLIDWL